MSRNNAQTISLDSFGFKRVSFLKVDVEGGDPLVIKGAQNLFRKKGLFLLLLKFHLNLILELL